MPSIDMDIHISNITQQIFSDFIRAELGPDTECIHNESSIHVKLPNTETIIEHRLYHRLGRPDAAEINLIITEHDIAFSIESLHDLKDIIQITKESNDPSKVISYITTDLMGTPWRSWA